MSSATHQSMNPPAAAQMHLPTFEIGDEVQLDTGEIGAIACIYRDFAWVFTDLDGFDTYEVSELRRPDPAHRTLG
ncbi:hypothetical protein [Rhizobium rhizogenes]|uniref:hypothetical protein n=1 Tax=Rhizobium rhizogenes TaxID=359 RepID=UPI0002EF04FE